MIVRNTLLNNEGRTLYYSPSFLKGYYVEKYRMESGIKVVYETLVFGDDREKATKAMGS